MRFTLVGLLVWCLLQPVAAAPRTGALEVQQVGKGERALILIPDLGCGAAIWDAVSAVLAREYVVYSVTLAGFDGTAAEPGPPAERALESLILLIREKQLVEPVLIGHGFGGYLALKLAATQPTLAGGVVLVESLPAFPPPVAGETPELRALRAERLAKELRGARPEATGEFLKQYLQAVPPGAKTAPAWLARVLRSDRETVIASLQTMSRDDLRFSLPSVVVPVLGLSAPEIEAEGREQLRGWPRFRWQGLSGSGRLPMLEQPTQLVEALGSFLKSLPAPSVRSLPKGLLP